MIDWPDAPFGVDFGSLASPFGQPASMTNRGAAVQNRNIMLGFEETAGLNI